MLSRLSIPGQSLEDLTHAILNKSFLIINQSIIFLIYHRLTSNCQDIRFMVYKLAHMWLNTNVEPSSSCRAHFHLAPAHISLFVVTPFDNPWMLVDEGGHCLVPFGNG